MMKSYIAPLQGYYPCKSSRNNATQKSRALWPSLMQL